ncbi:hypothetical protein BDZ94DRAFT_1168036 [Collybia nuda]|uniref:Uncharacterized protein n=1 Tax=Collybia nuda TaxID=64659 RepID=A0A9P6CD17_9AGAR|nr:hypothetical protein BDZ94DRAFT_1168036 [Collybia nuda]
MFPRGPRFEATKASDVPGPNSYNLVQDSQLDGYKRGAFLEKTDRFSKERVSEVPGPGAYDLDPKGTTMKTATKQRILSQNLPDRYAILQRKVEDLEKVHNDGKKAHQQEAERLKHDLARYQKSNAEQVERIEKQRRQADLLESRIQELKKFSTSEQAEVKDLRAKLRTSEHERTQMAGKQSEVGELKKSIQLLEARRRDETREKDRRIADLEKMLAGEKKKKEAVEARLLDLKGKGDEELQSARVAAQASDALLSTAHTEQQLVKGALEALEKESAVKEEEFLAQLEQHRYLLGLVAEEYGHLVSSSVPRTDHVYLKQQLTASQIRILRLERKLANSEGQVVELVNLVRQLREDNTFLTHQLREAEAEIHSVKEDLLKEMSIRPTKLDTSLEQVLCDVLDDLAHTRVDFHRTGQKTSDLLAELYRHKGEEILFAYSIANKQLLEAELVAQQYAVDLSGALASHEVIATLLESVQKERTTTETQLRVATENVDKLKASSEHSIRRITEIEAEQRETVRIHEESLKKERNMVKRLTGTVQTARVAEDAMRAEIETLTMELTNVEQYQEAYYSLSDEVGSLLARNQLAEDEAQRLSKFNAEILGHNNPAQRIMYVDRIRRELAEAKHKIVRLTQEQETVAAENEDLQQELGMYKSVVVPPEVKPRTTITRVARPPLVSLARSVNTEGATSGPNDTVSAEKMRHIRELETIPGDMTLDEIIY